MTQSISTTSNVLTFEEFLAYDDGTDTRYELVVSPGEETGFVIIATNTLNMRPEALPSIGSLTQRNGGLRCANGGMGSMRIRYT